MRRILVVLLTVGASLGTVLLGPLASTPAGAGPILPGPRALHVGGVAPSGARGHVVAPLSSGWIAQISVSSLFSSFDGGVSVFASGGPFGGFPVTPVVDSGPTGQGTTSGGSTLQGSMTGAHGAYNIQVALPVGQTIQVGQAYSTFANQASIIVSWNGGGCAASGTGGAGYFVVDQLTTFGGSATSYAIQFVCLSSTIVEGAFANNIVPSTPSQGYYTFDSTGTISGFGNDSYLSYLGSLGVTSINAPVVGMATTPDGGGYWLVSADGGLFAFGDAGFYGSMGGAVLNQPIVGMASTPDGHGYWMVASDGGIFAFGDAGFHGSMGGTPLNQPIMGMTSAPGGGYRLVASDGGIFDFGGAAFYGSMGARTLSQPIVGMTATPDGLGYWMVASDGGIFAFGDAGFHGSMGGIPLNAPVVGMHTSADGGGYWIVGDDGGVFAFGDAPFFGSLGGLGFGNVAGLSN